MAGVLAAWGIVAGLHLVGLRLANLWVFGLLLTGLGWLVALAATGLALRAMWRRTRSVPVLSLVLIPGVLAPVAILAVDWTSTFVHGFYRLHRTDFQAAATLADQVTARYGDRYGQVLPKDLWHLSSKGRAVRIGTEGSGPTGILLPVRVGRPDGAAGYAYFAGTPGDTRFDCFAEPCRVRWSLGDGWHWLD
ncbi:hypothetical protein GA0074692_4680 [Micromonospora pallida]|uniref:Uncharacterized protein n=1 Tax=Micromonospora pallida TaxID=145854 RepID=A0A1C6T748_9ACTN|nr:hypothetical protein GA0074692_4680 [Micromonospora pallida]